MCGILGCVGAADVVPMVIDGLANLEYRGYDSAGIAVGGANLSVYKRAGQLEALQRVVEDNRPQGPIGIGHTRWSTHGPPTDANAHPHCDCEQRVAVVHNGIIENYQTLRDRLTDAGHVFTSETDTEVIPHLIEEAVADGHEPSNAFRRALEEIEGSYAVAAVFADDDAIYGARVDSPLVLGIGEGRHFLASDVPAFLEHTDRVVYLEDGQFVTIRSDDWQVTDASGARVDVEVDRVEWDAEDTGKGGYEHYMLKEINEQPRALRDGIRGRLDELSGTIEVDSVADLTPPAAIHLVGCGTSYHAAAYGAYLFREHGIPASAFIASEYASSIPPLTSETAVIGVTQSGETADTLRALRAVEARSGSVTRIAVTNVVGSTAAREADEVVYIRAGPEIGVAATKTFASQLITLNLLAETILDDRDRKVSDTVAIIRALRALPDQVQAILDRADEARALAERYTDANAYFFIGRGYNAVVSLEGALKMKEITYKHAEGFPAGELKHGPLALVSSGTPVIATVTGTEKTASKTVGNVKEVEARGAPVIAVTDGQTDVDRYADEVLEIPTTRRRFGPVLANVQLQLLAYYTARALGRSIDRPRNLAKSVTVE